MREPTQATEDEEVITIIYIYIFFFFKFMLLFNYVNFVNHSNFHFYLLKFANFRLLGVVAELTAL